MPIFTGTYSASTQTTGGFEAIYAGDGYHATRWVATTLGSGQWIRIQLGSADVATYYVLGCRTTNAGYIPTAWTFEGSNDGTSWDVLDTRSGIAATEATKRFEIANSTSYLYYRLHITATGGGNPPALSEFQVGGGTVFKSFENVTTPTTHADATPYNMGVVFSSVIDGEVTHLRYYEPSSLTGTVTLRLYGAARAVLASVTHTAVSGQSGWRDVALSSPVAITAGTEYMAAMGLPGGSFARAGFSTDLSWDIWAGPIKIPAHNTATYDSLSANGRLGLSSSAFPDGYYGNAVYAVGVVFEEPGDEPVTGMLSVTDHADTLTISGDVTAGPVSGVLSVTDHADTATISGTGAGVGGAVTGTFQVVDHADTATIEGMVVSELDDIDTRPVRVRVAPRLHSVPVPAPIPAALASNVKPVARYSHVAPAITAANAPLTEGVDYPFATQVSVGYERLFVDDIDVTYWRDTPVIISRLSSSTPLGYSAASIEVPAMHPWEEPGVGECAWMRPDAPVKVALVDENDEIIVNLWSGFISKDSADLGQGRKSNGFTCDGIMWQAGYAQHEPPHYMPPTDIGTVIPDLLNSVPGKRYGDIPRVVTGIPTRTRGSSQQKIGQIVNEILQKEGWTVDGRQWTIEEVAPDEYRMVLKAPASTVHATVTYGVQGVEVSLERDQASRIDLIYGVGNAPNGGQWRGTRFPGLVLAQPPEYPNTDASSMHLGDTDADTDSGTGISDMQRRLVEMGYSLTVDGVLNANDIDVIRRLQGRMGLLVDGVPGPQTWSGIFNRGPEGIDLTQWREPLAALSWTQEHFRDPNGIILGDNPAFANTAKVQHPVEIHYGENITWTQAQPLAEKLLNVESTPALTGQIVLLTDPHEVSRRHLKAGQNVKVVGYQGRDVVLRIARMDMEADGRVILAVDERGRDALTVDQIRTRNLAAMADPVRRPGNPNRESRISRDRYVQWDIDSPCGFMPRTAVYGGLWVAPNPIPFAEVGRVVKTMLTCTVPFTLALFGLPVKPSQMHSIVGDPHTQDRPWEGEARVAALDALGWIISWGSQGERCGFSPNGQESSGAAFTGKFEEYGGFDFISGRPPYVWPLLFASETGFIGGAEAGGWGRFYPDTSV